MKTQVNDKFISKDHEARFMQLVDIKAIFANDVNYTSAGYLLSANEDVFHKVLPYISIQGINFDAIIKKVDLTSGQKFIVEVAMNLFRGAPVKGFDLSDIASCDFAMIDAILNAIKLYVDYEGAKASAAYYEKMMRSMGL